MDRHPHVFGDVKADTSAEVKRNWEALKVEERKKRPSRESASAAAADSNQPNDGTLPNNDGSILAGISSKMPSMLEASKLSSRAAQIGFDWPNVEGLFDKLHEEVDELKEQLKEFPRPDHAPEPRGCRIGPPGRS